MAILPDSAYALSQGDDLPEDWLEFAERMHAAFATGNGINVTFVFAVFGHLVGIAIANWLKLLPIGDEELMIKAAIEIMEKNIREELK